LLPVDARSAQVATRLARAVAQLDLLIDWERRRRANMRVSTQPERALLARMGLDQLPFQVVHVTGSKGKGSTSALIAAGMQRACERNGLHVGRYASPHLERVNERIAIDYYANELGRHGIDFTIRESAPTLIGKVINKLIFLLASIGKK